MQGKTIERKRGAVYHCHQVKTWKLQFFIIFLFKYNFTDLWPLCCTHLDLRSPFKTLWESGGGGCSIQHNLDQDWPRSGTGGKTGGFWHFASLGNLYRNKRCPTSDAVSRFFLKRSVVISAVASWLTNLTLASWVGWKLVDVSCKIDNLVGLQSCTCTVYKRLFLSSQKFNIKCQHDVPVPITESIRSGASPDTGLHNLHLV